MVYVIGICQTDFWIVFITETSEMQIEKQIKHSPKAIFLPLVNIKSGKDMLDMLYCYHWTVIMKYFNPLISLVEL